MAPSPSDLAAQRLLSRVFAELGGDDTGIRHPHVVIPRVPLPSCLSTGALAGASVAAVATAAGITRPLDPERITASYRSERLLTLDDAAPSIWSPYSGFWRTADGWIRTHANYPHHAESLLRGLGLPSGTVDPGPALAERPTNDSVLAITAAGGLAVAVSPENPDVDEALRRTALLAIESAAAPPRSVPPSGTLPLDGVRVLDLTRVIAGPVCTRTLALLGADVLRIDPPALPEPEWQHLDTGHGKRSALLDTRSPVFDELLSRADVVVLGYRPSALARRGLSPEALIDRHPGLIVAQLSAWGTDHPDRAGFDSLVQAASGIALIESLDGRTPGALPAQALDHSAGYLLAAAIVSLFTRRRSEGRSWIVRTSLRRIAAELLGMPRVERPESASDPGPDAHTVVFDIDGRRLRTAASVLPGLELAAPHPWGVDQPRW